MAIPRIAITGGEPAGIGPDILLQAAARDFPAQLVAIADPRLLRERAALLDLQFEFIDFDPDRDLIEVDDRRVWWESEHDKNDTENDHLMHVAMEIPFRRLVEQVVKAGGTLKVQDAYRASGIHASRSLHKEGRGIDLTCDEIGLEKLAKLTWAAGFDWVLFEAPKKGGWHVHASVRPVRDLQ